MHCFGEAHKEELGYAPAHNADFAADVEAIIRDSRPWNPPAWERSSISSLINAAERKP